MEQNEQLAHRFEEHRSHLRSVAYRMLGSLSEADDALQDAWIRASNADASEVENVRGWLTTIVARVCLNMLRSRKRRREDPLGTHLPDPIINLEGGVQPENEAVLSDAVSLAMLVVLETLSPAERLAFVLHDMFELPFDDIAPVVGRSSTATRQLASRARRRVRGAEIPVSDRDPGRQREAVDAFFRATRGGDFDALVTLLDPDVVLRADYGALRPPAQFRGVAAVSGQARHIPGAVIRPVLVNGAAGVIISVRGRPIALMRFTVVHGKIVEIDALADPQRVEAVAAGAF